MKNTKKVPAKIERLVYQEANSSCALCGERDIYTLEIHHIHSRANGGTNEACNLLVVCSNCHNRITYGSVTHQTVVYAKTRISTEGVLRA